MKNALIIHGEIKSSFSSTNSFMFFMPMFLLTFCCTVGSVPTTPINGFRFTIKTLKEEKKILFPKCSYYVLNF